MEIPIKMEAPAKDIIKKLLTVDRTQRLGCMRNGSEDVKNHKWFKKVNWTDVYNKKYTVRISLIFNSSIN